METQNEKEKMLYPHVSVDCVLLGANNDKLSVLLVEMTNSKSNIVKYKLPGSLIYNSEDLDDAAHRVLNETTGLKRTPLKQFHCFGSPARTKNKEDVLWLERTSNMKIERIVTIGYLALCKEKKRSVVDDQANSARWFPIDELPGLPFDHKEIVEASTQELRMWVEMEPAIVFDYLPLKFTAFQLRRIFEIIYNKEIDVRNFHKKLGAMSYVVSTNEIETGVAHRAARFYRFDKVQYNKQRTGFNKY